MLSYRRDPNRQHPQIEKSPTGIKGLDAILDGGVPKGRSTLISGGPGCGKTMLAVTFLVNGATLYDEPGVFFSFEEGATAIVRNLASIGFDLPALVAAKKLVIDQIRVELADGDETGGYDLEGLFIRLGAAIKAIGARRVVLDTLESLFVGFTDPRVLRAELQRLFRWLFDQGVTVLFSGEAVDGPRTRDGLEQFVADCVIALDNRVSNQIATRRLRVIKYRGSTHGMNEYPYLIDDDGITIIPITSKNLVQPASPLTISTGVTDLDEMLGVGGYYRGSSVCISGLSGTCKSTIAAQFAHVACGQGERCLYLLFEESSEQVLRNMRQLGMDLGPHVEAGLLRFQVSRPSLSGFEAHLVHMVGAINELEPSIVVIDPISAFRGPVDETHAFLLRIVDILKAKGITALLTQLERPGAAGPADIGISSIMDTWIELLSIDVGSEFNRGLRVLKSRGMKHTNQIREFKVGVGGISLIEAYRGDNGLLTGTAREIEERRRKEDARLIGEERVRREKEIERKRALLELQIASMRELQQEEEAKLLGHPGRELLAHPRHGHAGA